MQVEAFPRRQAQQGGLGRQRRTPHGKDELRVKRLNPYRQEDGTLYPRIYHGYAQNLSQCQVQRSPMFTVVHNPKKPLLDSHVIAAVAIQREREDAPGTYVSAISSVFSPFSAFNQARAIDETNFVHVQIKAVYDAILASYNASNFMKFHGCRALVVQIDKDMEWIARALCRFHDLSEKAAYDEIKLHQYFRYPELLMQLNGIIEGFEATTMLRVQFWPTDKEELAFAYQLVEKALDLHLMPTLPYDETLFDASDYDGSDYSIEDEELIDCVNSYEDDSHLIGTQPEDGDNSVDPQLVMDLVQQGQQGGRMAVRADRTVDGNAMVGEPGFALSSSEDKNVQKDNSNNKNVKQQAHSAGTTTIVNITPINANTINAPQTIEPATLAEPITPPNHTTAVSTPPPVTPPKIDSVMSSPIPFEEEIPLTPPTPILVPAVPVTPPKPKPTLSPMSISISDVVPRHWRLPSLPDFDTLPFSYSPPKKSKIDDASLNGQGGSLLPSPLPRPSSPTMTSPGANALLGGIVGLVNAVRNGKTASAGGLLGELGKSGRIGLR